MKRFLGRFIAAPVGLGGVSFYYFLRYPRLPRPGPPDADNEMFLSSREEKLGQLSVTGLVRGLFVHAFCAHPRLIDFGIWTMKRQHPIPVLDYVIRHTFFAQFCGHVCSKIKLISAVVRQERKP